MSEAKDHLRTMLKAHRLAMSEDTVANKSKVIADKLLAGTDWSNVKKMHIYSSVLAWKEVDSKLIIDAVQREWPSIEITVAELSKSQPIPKKQYDLVVVPALGFDKQNHRLGLGGGFYDRFLATQPKALKVGICFQNGFLKNGLPAELHDIPLDKFFTEV